MRQHILVFFIIQATFTGLHSQNIRQLSLQEAVKTALDNVVELKNMRLDEQIQEAKNKEIVGSALPQVSASAQTTYYTNLPKIAFPTSDISVYKVLASEGVKDGAGNTININKASFGVQEVSFVAPFNYQFGLSLQQLLFQPDVFVAVQARNTVMELTKQNTVVAEQRVKESVQKAYYSVLIANKQKIVLSETRQRLEKLNKEMTEMLKNGFAEKLDIDKLSVALNNATTAQNQLDNAIRISEAALKSAMGIPQSDSIVLTDQLELKNIQSEIMMAENPFNYSDRSEFALLEISRKLQDLDLKRYKMAYLPTVAAFYQLQRSGQRNSIYDINGSGPWFAFTTGLVGVSINQPIFDGFQRKYRIEQAKLSMQKVENSMVRVKEMIDLEQSIAKNSINNALLNLEIQQRNMDLAQSVYNTTRIKYQSGLGSSFELLQTDTELQRAIGNYFQALYEAYIQKVNYMKSIGKL
jgi:outer membrane protein TolC